MSVRPEEVVFGPDQALYFVERLYSRHSIRKIRPVSPEFDLTEIVIPSESGDRFFVFNPSGRHLRTVDSVSGQVLLNFDYDPQSGYLSSITDLDGDVTTIERDPDGRPVVLVGSSLFQATHLKQRRGLYFSASVQLPGIDILSWGMRGLLRAAHNKMAAKASFFIFPVRRRG